MKRKDIATLAVGAALGAALVGGANASSGILAQPSWQDIYVNGQKVNMTAYNIDGSNFVKLRDIGQAVGFNVYWSNGVQVDSNAPYTGEAPSQAQPQIQTQASQATPAESVRINCYKNLPLAAGDGSGLMIYPSGTEYTVASSDPSVVTVENVLGVWKVNAVSPGAGRITATAPDGRTGSVEVTVVGGSQQKATGDAGSKDPDIGLSANMDIRQEMIRLINETRRANGVAELTVNGALMNAAQDCAGQHFSGHNNRVECESALAYGYPHGFGSNLAVLTGSASDAARRTVKSWINSPGHMWTMLDASCDCVGVGVANDGVKVYCYMFAGDPNSHNPYE